MPEPQVNISPAPSNDPQRAAFFGHPISQVATLIAANVLPVIGVVFWRWSAVAVIMLYWAENIPFLLFTLLRFLWLPKRHLFEEPRRLLALGGYAVLFPVVVIGHGVLLTTILSEAVSRDTTDRWVIEATQDRHLLTFLRACFAEIPWFAWTLACLLVSHGIDFVRNYVQGRQYKTATFEDIRGTAFTRLMAIYLTVPTCGVALNLAGMLLSPVIAPAALIAVVLIVLRMSLDAGWLVITAGPHTEKYAGLTADELRRVYEAQDRRTRRQTQPERKPRDVLTRPPWQRQSFKVDPSACGADGLITVGDLMLSLQNAAVAHAEALKFGRATLDKLDAYWVLANFYLRINRLPRTGETVTLLTWPSGSTRAVATREFQAFDAVNAIEHTRRLKRLQSTEGPMDTASIQDVESLLTASSEWMVLGRPHGRAKNLHRLGLQSIPTAGRLVAGPLERLQPPRDARIIDAIRVPHSAIDVNNHVNNTQYVRWALKALARAEPNLPPIQSLHITYLAEAFENDELTITLVPSPPADDQAPNVEHRLLAAHKAPDDTPIFAMKITCR